MSCLAPPLCPWPASPPIRRELCLEVCWSPKLPSPKPNTKPIHQPPSNHLLFGSTSFPFLGWLDCVPSHRTHASSWAQSLPSPSESQDPESQLTVSPLLNAFLYYTNHRHLSVSSRPAAFRVCTNPPTLRGHALPMLFSNGLPIDLHAPQGLSSTGELLVLMPTRPGQRRCAC